MDTHPSPQPPVESPAGQSYAPVVSAPMADRGGMARKRLVVILAAVLVLLIVGATSFVLLRRDGGKTITISDTVANVSIQASGYVPATIKVAKGQEITWINNDTAPHRITADQDELPAFDTRELLEKGDSYTYVFETPGTYRYYDPADSQGFVGTIVVE